MTPPQHLWFFSAESMRRMAASLGLELEHFDHPWKIVPLVADHVPARAHAGAQAGAGPVRQPGRAAGQPVRRHARRAAQAQDATSKASRPRHERPALARPNRHPGGLCGRHDGRPAAVQDGGASRGARRSVHRADHQPRAERLFSCRTRPLCLADRPLGLDPDASRRCRAPIRSSRSPLRSRRRSAASFSRNRSRSASLSASC